MRGKEKVPSSIDGGGKNAQEKDCHVLTALLKFQFCRFYLHTTKYKPGDTLINCPRFENRDPR